MEGKPLLEYATHELLAKFGQGSHKPGSGSAAAFEGMLSAQLIHTVIGISNDEKHRKKYEKWLPELLEFDKDIVERIYPSLEELFQSDAKLFDKVIVLRRKRDAESDPERQRDYNRQALTALRPATDILTKIANHCADLADYAARVFDNGFKYAKGDSSVALNGAVGALGGCLSILDLNLSYFGSDDWASDVREELEILRADYDKLSMEARNRMNDFTLESRAKSFAIAKTDLNSGRWEGVNLSDAAIESLASQASNLLWDFRDLIWPSEIPTDRYDVLKPEVVLEKILGYRFGYASLGRNSDKDGEFEIAGQIDKEERLVVVSSDVSSEVRKFTSAHELGHALLHADMKVLHRDRPLDGVSAIFDVRERQANRFAACFVMPRQLVRNSFRKIFSAEKFVVDQNTVFRLRVGSLNEFTKKYSTRRSLARFIASYGGGTFQPLHKVFGVSVEAMAIRLEELELV